MGQPDTNVADLCAEPGVTRQTLYRHVSPKKVPTRRISPPRTLTTSGIPARRYPGFWDNVGQCCGSAGVAEFFLGMHFYTGNPAYMTFASTVLDDLVDRGVRDGAGLRWHNIDPGRTPPELPAETGYMQGAAGIGLALLHGYQAARGADPGSSLPDSPFRP